MAHPVLNDTADGDDPDADEQDADDTDEGDSDDEDADNSDDDDDDYIDVGAQVIAQVADAANALTLAAELLREVGENQLPPAPELKATYDKFTDAMAVFGQAWRDRVTANR